jgi:RNA polymerase sigma-70 factor (ECF subfamily)
VTADAPHPVEGGGPRAVDGAGAPAARSGPPADQVLVALIGAVARGDEQSFDELYDHLAPAVFGTVRSVLRDPAQSEEVTQEVLVEIWRCAPRFERSRGSAMAWVTTVAHRRAVDRVRAEQKAAERELRVAGSRPAVEDVAESVEVRLDHQRVRRCLGTLTEIQREALTLTFFHARSHREVAALLGLPLGTVNTRIRDGLIRLRDCLGVEA